ncbi:MAG: DUF350 domain-containing protein [Candidatus Micrarchaeota archaeon]|nr:DUF350 domain-containing protein [Candidatus Micrarchaeota archaeon]
MVYESALAAVIVGIAKLFSSVILAVGSIYIGLKSFDKLTAGIDELLEIKKGNVAVGIFFFSILIAIAVLIRPSVAEFAAGIEPGYSLNLMAVLALINLTKLAFSLMIAIIAIFCAFSLLDKLTSNMDEVQALKKGNIAVALLIAGLMLSVSFIVEAGMQTMSNIGVTESCAIAASLEAKTGADFGAATCISGLVR